MKTTILQKLQEARDIIKRSDLKKTGRNKYSKFDYYTPEQVEALVEKACKETKTICLCNLKSDEFGLFQTLDFIDLEDENNKLHFELRTKHGSLTATNETQQMGGTDTYSERYIKMKVFQIKDNNLDLDSHDNRPKKEYPKTIPAHAQANPRMMGSGSGAKIYKKLEELIIDPRALETLIGKKVVDLTAKDAQEVLLKLSDPVKIAKLKSIKVESSIEEDLNLPTYEDELDATEKLPKFNIK
jgi:hypothetical protein